MVDRSPKHRSIISVVMAVFNGEQYVEGAITSILEQSYRDFEFVIIDDGSTDDTKKIVEHFSRIDQRVILISRNHAGLTASLNIGINLSTGQYIARQDADDRSAPDRLAKQLYWVRERGYDLCCTRAKLSQETRITPRLLHMIPLRWILRYMNPVIHGTLMINRSILSEVGGYDEKFVYAQDYKLVCDLISINARIKYLTDPLYTLHKHSESITSKHSKQQQEYGKLVQQSYINHRSHDSS